MNTEINKKLESERGGVANIHKAFYALPEMIAAHYDFYKNMIIAENLPLDRVEREYLAVLTSSHNSCRYCYNHHLIALEKNILKLGKAIQEDRKIFFQDIAKTLTLTPERASSLKDAAIESGFNNAEYAHMVVIVAYFAMANRLAFGMGIELEENFERLCS